MNCVPVFVKFPQKPSISITPGSPRVWTFTDRDSTVSCATIILGRYIIGRAAAALQQNV